MKTMAKTPKLLYGLLCDDVRQEMGGKISVMGLFGRIWVKKFPATHTKLAVVTAWGMGEGEFSAGIKLLGPGGKEIADLGAGKIVLREQKQTHRDIGIFINLRFEKPGEYAVEILLDGKRAGLIPFTVAQQSVEPAPSGA